MCSPETLQIAGYREQPVPNTFFRQDEATDHVAIVFPGVEYTCQMPLLYYPTRLLAARGADVLCVEYSYGRPEIQALTEEERARWFVADVTAACHAALEQRPYNRVTVVGKSLGTLAMGHLFSAEAALADAEAIWLTPILRDDRLRAQIRAWGGKSLFVIGTADRYYDPALLEEVCRSTRGGGVPVPDADHSLEIKGDVWRSLEIIEGTLRIVIEFLDN
jgi:hypothetical protein